MPLTGTLRTWNDDRGFGFIAPTHGGAEIFVHISAFPRDGSRPTAGESLTYELGRGDGGKPQAAKVWRTAIGRDAHTSRKAAAPRAQGRSFQWIAGVVLLVAAGAYGYVHYNKRIDATRAVQPAPAGKAAPAEAAPAQTPRFSCDGRQYCSQMTSCAEATFFLKNCPGTQMDGDNDGVPCEEQWCTSPFAR
ncbi:MAG: cold shock domain-containing protein [Betaproteobacteria bacterium]|nr:cold shock domain-containing protein [Betaproteobacteria bacterium]